MAFNISKEKTMEGVMSTLSKLYEKPLNSNELFLMKHLFNMKMSEVGSFADHLNQFSTVTNKLSYVGVKFDYQVRYILILCSFPKRWNILVMAVSNSIPSSNTFKFDDVVSVILSEEMRRKSTGEKLGNALTMESKG